MTVVRSLLFNLAFGLATVAMGVVGLPVFLAPGRWASAYGRLWARVCMFLLKWIVGLDWEVRGAPPAGAALVVAKHQSAWETLALTLLLNRPAFVMKRSLLLTPPFGPYLAKAGMVAIDRSAGAQAIRRMTAGARAAMAEGRAVAIFPEGTRRAVGAPPAYRSGAAALYRGLGVEAVPVALNSGLYWGRNAFAKRPGRIVVEFLEPIPPGLDRRAFMARLENAIETATDRLVQEAEQTGGIVRQ